MKREKYKLIELDGKRFYLVPIHEADYGPANFQSMLPPAAADGTRDALETSRILLAQKIAARRKAVGLSQRALAERAGIAFESLNRIETGKVRPEVKTVEKIDKALVKAEKAAK